MCVCVCVNLWKCNQNSYFNSKFELNGWTVFTVLLLTKHIYGSKSYTVASECSQPLNWLLSTQSCYWGFYFLSIRASLLAAGGHSLSSGSNSLLKRRNQPGTLHHNNPICISRLSGNGFGIPCTVHTLIDVFFWQPGASLWRICTFKGLV